MNKIVKSWPFHNLIAHPTMQLLTWCRMPLLAERVHDNTLPESLDTSLEEALSGWTIKQGRDGAIIVQAEDGSGIVVGDDDEQEGIAAAILYRLAQDLIAARDHDNS